MRYVSGAVLHCTAVGRMCGLSTVVTPAGASLTMYREIRPYANSTWDDNNNNNNYLLAGKDEILRKRETRSMDYQTLTDKWVESRIVLDI